jgi:hypothetical protein
MTVEGNGCPTGKDIAKKVLETFNIAIYFYHLFKIFVKFI